MVRIAAQTCFEQLVEINLEREPELRILFTASSPQDIIQQLGMKLRTRITPGQTLLFLDEIQAAPELFAKLRYFYEDMPALHVIAAGSLLDFSLQEHSFSMPVGRIEYLHLGPMDFEECLLAAGHAQLVEYLRHYRLQDAVPEALHRELLRQIRLYLLVGGMPEAVNSFWPNQAWRECDMAKQSILATYRDDFGKYATPAQQSRLQKVFAKIPLLVGKKFKYSQVDREEGSRELGAALRKLCLARVALPVLHSSGNGVPLGAESDERTFKILFLDVGLLSRACGLTLDAELPEDLMLVNAGAVVEQFVGQHLWFSRLPYEDPELHYWIREKATASAEVDYLVSEGTSLIPVEVKAGRSGTLKSLHLFLREKRREFGVRFNCDPPSLLEGRTALPDGGNKNYRLLSLPLYLVGQFRRLCREAR